jgi:hypothetical protein
MINILKDSTLSISIAAVILYLFINKVIYFSSRSSLKRIHILSIIFSIASSVFYFALVVFVALAASFVDHGTITVESAFV